MTIVINGVSITFPISGTDPNWAEAVDMFAQNVAIALAKVGLPSDVSPQTVDISSTSNPGTLVPIVGLSFSTALVRAAFINYAVFRTTNSNTSYECGQLECIYNPNGSLGSLWEVSREFTGNSGITFYITDTGQVEFSMTALSGLNYSAQLSFSAITFTQTSTN